MYAVASPSQVASEQLLPSYRAVQVYGLGLGTHTRHAGTLSLHSLGSVNTIAKKRIM